LPNLDIAEGLYLRESVADGENTWLELLEKGKLPAPEAGEDPGEFCVGLQWKPWLANQEAGGVCNARHTSLLLGIIEYNANKVQEAIQLWNKSNAIEPSAWAHRNLAVAYAELGQTDKAWEHYSKALALLPSQRYLAIEAADFLIDHKRTKELSALVSKIDPSLRSLPRIRLALAYGALFAGRLDEVERFFASPFRIEDIREGDNALTDLWFDFQAAKRAAAEGVPVNDSHKDSARNGPPPKGFDFRMHIES